MTNDKDRILVVAVDALGWRTQLASLGPIVEQRGDIELDILKYTSPRPLRILLKDIYPGPLHRRLSLVSQAQMAGWVLKQPLARQMAAHRYEAALFLGHFTAAAALPASFSLPFSVYADVTIALAQRRFGARGFRQADLDLERRIFEKARHVFGSGETIARSIVEDYGIDPRKVSICPPLIHFDGLNAPLATQPGQDLAGQAKIGFIGNDFNRKGGNILVEAFGRLGGGSTLEVVTQASAHRDDLPGVSFRSNVPHAELMKDFLPSLDIFVLPSREDLSPLVLIEAAAAGLPVVASNVGAIPDIVQDEQTGLLVPSNDVPALTAALRRLVDDPALRRRLGQAARQRAVQFYDVNRNSETLLDRILATTTVKKVA